LLQFLQVAAIIPLIIQFNNNPRFTIVHSRPPFIMILNPLPSIPHSIIPNLSMTNIHLLQNKTCDPLTPHSIIPNLSKTNIHLLQNKTCDPLTQKDEISDLKVLLDYNPQHCVVSIRSYIIN
jgi:hypothetical protein